MNTIRAMIAADKPKVLDLLRRTNFFNEEEVDVAEELIDCYLTDCKQNDYDVVIINDEAQTPAGYLCYGPSPLTEGTFDLYWIAISPEQQGRGLGKQLVKWLENKLEEKHGRVIIIETSSQEKYKATRQFYLNMHYQECVRIADFYKPGDDRIIYAKYLEQTGSLKHNE
jgi:ribosomal protein S18 acetylase RimI-like enzyme